LSQAELAETKKKLEESYKNFSCPKELAETKKKLEDGDEDLLICEKKLIKIRNKYKNVMNIVNQWKK